MRQTNINEDSRDSGEGDIDAEEEQHIRDICSQDNILSSHASSPSTHPVLSPQEWLARPSAAWFSDEDQSDELERDRLLICASLLVTQIRKDIRDRLGFTCSAGIAHTKMLAKVCRPYPPSS